MQVEPDPGYHPAEPLALPASLGENAAHLAVFEHYVVGPFERQQSGPGQQRVEICQDREPDPDAEDLDRGMELGPADDAEP